MRPDPAAWTISFEGAPIPAAPGQSVAASLLMAGHVALGTAKDGTPRGAFCGMGVCHDCLVTIDGQAGLRACVTKVRNGMRVERQPLRLDAADAAIAILTKPPAFIPEASVDLLVIGAGPAGLASAEAAAEAGASVLVIDERPAAGGQYYKQPATRAAESARDAQAREGAALIARVASLGVETAPDQVRGYSAVGGEGLSFSLDEPTPPDIKESLSIGPVDVPSDDPYFTSADAGPHFAKNVWPAEPAELKPIWTEYFTAVDALATDLMRLFALALKLPEDYFDDTIDKNISMMRVLRYPRQTTLPLPGQLRAGAHSDYGSMTILRKEVSDHSLEVKNKEGAWVGVPVIEGSFIVNIGDLMQQWTNDTWISTVHRVVNPPLDSEENRDRLSIVFFHQPNYDAMVDCLPGCEAPGQPPKYEPISSGDHLRSKFVKQTTFGKGDKAA